MRGRTRAAQVAGLKRYALEPQVWKLANAWLAADWVHHRAMTQTRHRERMDSLAEALLATMEAWDRAHPLHAPLAPRTYPKMTEEDARDWRLEGGGTA